MASRSAAEIYGPVQIPSTSCRPNGRLAHPRVARYLLSEPITCTMAPTKQAKAFQQAGTLPSNAVKGKPAAPKSVLPEFIELPDGTKVRIGGVRCARACRSGGEGGSSLTRPRDLRIVRIPLQSKLIHLCFKRLMRLSKPPLLAVREMHSTFSMRLSLWIPEVIVIDPTAALLHAPVPPRRFRSKFPLV